MGLNKFLGQGTIYLFGSMLSAAVPFLLLPCCGNLGALCSTAVRTVLMILMMP